MKFFYFLLGILVPIIAGNAIKEPKMFKTVALSTTETITKRQYFFGKNQEGKKVFLKKNVQ